MRLRQIAVFMLATVSLALAGCGENDRPTSYTPGVYSGKPDTELTPEQVETLRQRATRVYN